MAMQIKRNRIVTALLVALVLGTFASLAMGQSHLANPRFRRRAAKQYQVRRSPVRAAPSRATGVATADHTAPSSTASAGPTSRAQQALWHAQSDRERQAISHASAEIPRSFGYRPKHQRVAAATAVPRSTTFNLPKRGQGISGGVFASAPISPAGSHEYYDGAVLEGETYIDGESYIEGETYLDGETYVEGDGVWEGDVAYEYEDEICGCDGGCLDCLGNTPPGAVYFLGDLNIFSGVQGFINPINQGISGSFGFQQGFNLGTALPFFPYSGWGYQIGLRGTQTNNSGSGQANQKRRQTFFTTGIFRPSDHGLQMGAVVDVLNDDWVGTVNLTQARGQIGWVFNNFHEFGYWFAASNGRDTTQGLVGQINVSVSDVQAFYYRHESMALPGAFGRLMFGWSNDSDGLFAAEAQVPLSARTSLLSSATYLIPDESTGTGGAENEVWNIGLTLIFSFRGSGACCRAPFAPLFQVADNGRFFVDLNQAGNGAN